MTLKEIRTNKGLTQEQAALLINVPLRTYKRYETDESYVDSYKYKMFVNELNNKTLVDEEHGLLTIEQIKEIVTPILNKYDIHYCYRLKKFCFHLRSAHRAADRARPVPTCIFV